MASADESVSADQDEPTDSAMSGDTGRCRLLELPAELQLSIFELAVVHDEPIQVNPDRRVVVLGPGFDEASRQEHARHEAAKKAWRSVNDTLRLQPPLSRACKTVRCDVLELYYGRNTFEADYGNRTLFGTVCAWLKAMGVENRRQLKEFFVYDPTDWEDYYMGPMVGPYELERKVAGLGGRITEVTVKEGDRYQVRFE